MWGGWPRVCGSEWGRGLEALVTVQSSYEINQRESGEWVGGGYPWPSSFHPAQCFAP